jgi:hypothetical protein
MIAPEQYHRHEWLMLRMYATEGGIAIALGCAECGQLAELPNATPLEVRRCTAGSSEHRPHYYGTHDRVHAIAPEVNK